MRAGSRAFDALRAPAVAGRFYPRAPAELRREVVRLLAGAPVQVARRPKALVVPHAGYVYSGPIAASAYAQLRAPGPPVTRVVLIGPAHHVPVAGLALPEASRFLTPLGEVPVDQPLAARLLRLPQVTRSAAAHALEHSLEVQLPFLQALLEDFTILPLAVGRASPEDVAEVLREAWGGEETLLVISTDLSHYLAQDEARALDERTARAVLALDAGAIGPEQACGQHGLAGLLVEARRRGLGCTLLDLRSSGDTAGDPDAVVGYGAFALGAEDREADGHGTGGRQAAGRAEDGREAAGGAEGARVASGRAADAAGQPAVDAARQPAAEAANQPAADAARQHSHRGRILTGLARAAIASLFGHPAPQRPNGEPWLDEHRACFVSLHQRGELRGCIGATAPRASLFEELVHCARAAAAEDPRFEPVAEPELPGLSLEVSVLSPMEPVPVTGPGKAEALAALRPGVDGLLLEAEGRRAVFIPAMWEELPDPADFVGHLRRKAGLPPGWSPGTRLQRFTAERYQEEGAP